MLNHLEKLNDALRDSMPNIYVDLQPGVQTRMGAPRDLREWFSWRNGQPDNTTQEMFGAYVFVNYEAATAELAGMRSTLWKSPLHCLFLLALSRRSFYTIPLMTDGAGDGYCYDLIRRRPYYRFEGERDIPIPSFDVFLDFVADYVTQQTVSAATSFEERFLQEYD